MTVYLFVMMITPGPNNTMLMASGLNFGARRTIPHILGIMCGFPILFSLVGLGLGKLFEIYPVLNDILKYCGSAYLLWLSWRIATSQPSEEGQGTSKTSRSRPLTWLEGVAIQVLNVKGWIAAIAGNATYIVGNDWTLRLITADMVIFVSIGISSAVWTGAGVGLKKIMRGKSIRIINIILALLLAASVALVIM